MSWMVIIAISVFWLAVCLLAWALVRAGDLADKKASNSGVKR